MQNNEYKVTKENVEAFLSQFHQKLKVFSIIFRDDRGKNAQTLADLEITPKYRETVIKEIKAEDALKINVFSVPDELYNKNLELVYQGDNKYTLILPETKKSPEEKVSGEIGKLLSYKGLLLNLQNVTAEIGDSFTITKLSKLKSIEAIKDNLSISDVGKDTGILTFNFVGTDKDKIQLLLNSVIKNYEHQNKEFEVLSAGRSLEFIDKQLPVTKDSLRQAEDQLNEFRHKNATLDLSLEAQSVMQNLTKIESELTTLDTKEAEISELFTKDHPNYQALSEQKKVLQKAKAEIYACICR